MEDLNPDSLKIVEEALIEPAVIEEKPDVRYQFEREGYFYADPVDYSDERPVFNRIVTLKDSWAKKAQEKPAEPKERKRNQAPKEKRAEPERESKQDDTLLMSDMERERFADYRERLGLRAEVASTLARDEELSAFFKEALELYEEAENIAKIVANEVAREMKKSRNELAFGAKHVAQLAKMLDRELISTKIAKELFEEMAKSGEEPESIVEKRGLIQISDPETLTPVIEEVIASNPENLKRYKEGNERLFGFFVGEVLKATGGKANPKVVNTLLRERLKG
jgi:glutaminyl-tRNA synthetase